MGKYTQEQQVIDAIRKLGGHATLRRLYETMDFSSWKSKTPDASVRKIVQESDAIFRIQPGLWALEECRDDVMRSFGLNKGDKKSEEKFTHAYYQGLLVEIGRMSSRDTYVPAQDRHRRFLDRELGEISDMTRLPAFTHEHLLRKARTVDVIWFNERVMPSFFYEVEHTTDIKNSLIKFYELQDFHSQFRIVADKRRESEFQDKIGASIFSPIRDRVRFLDYDTVAKQYTVLQRQKELVW